MNNNNGKPWGSFNFRGPEGPGGKPPIYDTDAIKNAGLKLFKFGRRAVIVAALLVLAVVLAAQSVVVANPNEFKVIRQFGEIKTVVSEPGISLKLPFIQTVQTLPKMVCIYDIPISDVITQDKKSMVVDSFVLWRIEDPTEFIRNLGGNIVNAEVRIGNIAYNSMKNVISNMPQSEIISGRDKVADRIVANIGNSLEQYGVQLVGIETKHIDLPDDNKEAVYTRMISERKNIAAAFQAEGEEEGRMIRTETDKVITIMLSEAEAVAAQTMAEGEQAYMEILAEAYNTPSRADFYAYVRALDSAKASLKGDDTTLILSKDSPIAQVFYNLQ